MKVFIIIILLMGGACIRDVHHHYLITPYEWEIIKDNNKVLECEGETDGTITGYRKS